MLVRMLAEMWGIRVRAGLGLQEADEGDHYETAFIEDQSLGTVWEYDTGSPPFIVVPPFATRPEPSQFRILRIRGTAPCGFELTPDVMRSTR